jgi:Flp pilus assembly secretin CpaC
MRTSLPAAAWLALLLALVPLLATAGTREPQVHVESRLVEVNVEFMAELGIGIDSVDSHYRSTGAQEPADTQGTKTSGLGGGGVNLMATRFPDGDGPVGVGASGAGFFAGKETIFGLKRHPGGDESNNVIGKREVKSAVAGLVSGAIAAS